MARYYSTLVMFVILPLLASAQSQITTSLHYTREGKNTAYRAENGGMERITGIPMSQLTCQKCHSTSEVYPNGDPIDAQNYAPSCKDCHDFATGTSVSETTCLGCHNRQKYERDAYPDIDVHSKAGLNCVSCHSKEEIHGDDGVAYPSLKASGAIKKSCATCHTNVPSNSAHSVHANTVDCAACHAQSVLTCSSCHFESLLATGKNRAINQLRNYRLLVKKDGKIRLGGFMTHTYNGKTNYIISSYHSHIIKKEAIGCVECHHNMGGTNAAIGEYNSTGTITMTTWNENTKKIVGPSGVVPIPLDWKQALKMNYAHYTGDPSVVASDPTKWEFLTSETDNAHLFYCEPLDASTMQKLGFTRLPNGIAEPTVAASFTLSQNSPNPFSGNTTISFSLEGRAVVTLSVYNTLGQLVARPLNEVAYPAGKHDIRFDAGTLRTGLYLYALSVGSQRVARKMVIQR